MKQRRETGIGKHRGKRGGEGRENWEGKGEEGRENGEGKGGKTGRGGKGGVGMGRSYTTPLNYILKYTLKLFPKHP